jgi:beta-phosphoglucomutase-like phosphatase (HAD superfamily)
MSTQLSETIGEHVLPEELISALDDVKTVLLDIGGVLAADSWEWLILTPTRGLADRFGLPRDVAEQVGKRLWRKYSLIPSTADQYWSEFAAAVSIAVPPPLTISELEDELITASPTAFSLLSYLADRDLRIGVISDNTSFWYARQTAMLDLDSYVLPEVVYLSFEQRRNKKADVSLFEIAARGLDAGRTLVVDDRRHNVERAQSFGFQAVQFAAMPVPS